ncbi:hypothetical protein GJ744_004554 [Endocarpon pusillum]|uniref:Uncharacterized protein n=1 Tax=Endocarpon pusillum TaxID=364733 RepID=A0A8H7ATS7_9EURO|nr:hypothetical protein GJ744_004554 [Endocarpon pusillum]
MICDWSHIVIRRQHDRVGVPYVISNRFYETPTHGKARRSQLIIYTYTAGDPIWSMPEAVIHDPLRTAFPASSQHGEWSLYLSPIPSDEI